jgi:hypothetical protein
MKDYKLRDLHASHTKLFFINRESESLRVERGSTVVNMFTQNVNCTLLFTIRGPSVKTSQEGAHTLDWIMFNHLRILHKFYGDLGHATICLFAHPALAADVTEIQPITEEIIDRSYLVDVNGINLLPNWAGSLLNPVVTETAASNPHVVHG